VITAALFRQNLPEFADQTRYPDSGIIFWLNVAYGLLNQNQNRFGNPGQPSLAAALAVGGLNYAVGDQWTPAGGQGPNATQLLVKNIGAGGTITAVTLQAAGYYFQLPGPNPVSQGSTTGAGSGATFNLTYSQKLGTLYDMVTSLFVAHNVVLERRAQDEAEAGITPGVATGPISSKSVKDLSVAYATGDVSLTDGGHFGGTTYGQRFIYLARIKGMGPLVAIGRPAPYGPYNGQAWTGPLVDVASIIP